MSTELIDTLLAHEHAGWKSLCDGTGADYYQSNMTDEGVMILANGGMMTRAEVAEALVHAPPWDGYEIHAPRLIPLTADSVALLYTGIAHREHGDDFVALMSSVYVRRDGHWMLAVYSQTPVATANS